ncbi:MAG: type II CAAX endopeptidase family protein [Candidatus Acidiferrales bacterium]
MEAMVGSEPRDGSLTLDKFIWAMSLLIIITWALNQLGTVLLLNVIKRHELTSYWPAHLVDQTMLIAMVIFSVELAVVLCIYRPLRSLFTLQAEKKTEKRTRHRLVIGAVGGVCAFLASIPLLFYGGGTHILTPQLLSYPVSLSVVCQLGLLLVVVPGLSELVFRGVAFRSLYAASSLWPAAIGSSLLFACVWPVPTTAVAVILGIATALVFHKTRALISSILTNVTLTILVETFLVLHDLHFF